jgi:hypothetical protein
LKSSRKFRVSSHLTQSRGLLPTASKDWNKLLTPMAMTPDAQHNKCKGIFFLELLIG